MNQKTVAIIPARGGSKRLPRKNILPLGGRPIISWTINAAIESNIFDDIYVSTDDDEIASISLDCGVQVLNRPLSLATDQASVSETFYYHLTTDLNANDYRNLFCLYPTSALRDAQDIINIHRLLTSSPRILSVVACSDYFYYPYQALERKDDCQIVPFWPELVRLRSDKLPKFVAGNGSTYAIETSEFLKSKDFYLANSMYAYTMPKWKSIDVDTADDFFLLEAVFSRLHKTPDQSSPAASA